MSMLTYIVPCSWSLLTLLFTLNAAIYGLTKCRGNKKPPMKAPKPAGTGDSSSSTSQKNKSVKSKSNDATPSAEAALKDANVKDLDPTQDTKNSTKKVDGEKEKKEEDKDKDDKNADADEKLKPKTIARNEKEQKIAAGETRKKTDYPTFNDVESDWDSDKEKDEKKKAEAKAAAAAGDGKDGKTKDVKDGKETEKKGGKEAVEKDGDNPPAPKRDEAKDAKKA